MRRLQLSQAFVPLIGLLTGVLGPDVALSAEPVQRPNIFFALADDWSWPHAGVYGDTIVKTPVFDQVAAEGVLFTHTFCAAPTCTASRAAMLTGQAIHRLEEGANLYGTLPRQYQVYPDILEAAGYAVGFMGKGWAPGTIERTGRTRNPAGPNFKSLAQFLKTVPKDKPFCFWYGSRDPHRPYVKGSGRNAGMNPDQVAVPSFLPNTAEVRNDILDYYFAVQRYDADVGAMLKLLKESGQLDNTIVVMTGDNGWPFPRAKANLYDAGTRQPLAVRWPARIKGGRTVHDYISFMDLAPTFLEAAGLRPLPEMTGRSFLDVLTGARSAARDRVFLERERHANVRKGDLSYPCRALRTREFLYIRNFRPERWPAGDPEKYKAVGDFGDVDASPTKEVILSRRDEMEMARFFRLAFGKRPADELYDLSKDPDELTNVANQPDYAAAKQKLRAELAQWMKKTADPRASVDDDRWDKFPYFGPVSEPRK
jgi:N-sulfoglucosamine sulfohydrolase